jgi:ATP-binding protein involved in chromosome partitioning
LAEESGAPLLGNVPLDLALREAGDRGIPVVIDAPGASSALELTRIATALPTPARKFAGKALPLAVV